MSDAARPALNYAFARTHACVVLEEAPVCQLGVMGTLSPYAMIEARRALGRSFTLVPMERRHFEQTLSQIYAADDISDGALEESGFGDESLANLVDDIPKTADLLDEADDAPVIRLINALIAQGIRSKASDIHVEPFENELVVRERVDGTLRQVFTIPAKLAPFLISRIKVMARLDIAEKRLPQDGRTSLSLGGKSVDVRVSTLPSRFGERVVLRLLDKDDTLFSLPQLGMAPEMLAAFEAALHRPNGILLVTGPTGSGKTTTLYAALSSLNDHNRNILTVEDPVEYALDGVGQTQINPKIGMSFAAGLRAILRQDPDVVMVGEIRDQETAEIAVQSSLTGHIVLSTVHTNSAIAAVTRLRDMGIESFLLASTLSGVLAQRLVRRLCDSCKEAYEPSDADLANCGLAREPGMVFHRAKGCGLCNHEGYRGRFGLYEFVSVDDRLKQMIHDEAPEQELSAYAFRAADTLRQSGGKAVLAGETSVSELLRVVSSEGV